MPTHEFTHRTPYSLDEVWEWFNRPGALHRLSPPWLPVQPAQEADDVRDGEAALAVAPYGIKLPLPSWRASHVPSAYADRERFEDRTTSQPYAALTGWRHEHDFVADGADATLVRDRVTTRVPRFMLDPVFAYRGTQIDDDLAAHQRFPGTKTVAITGSGGLIGRQLAALLSTGGHRVIELVRSPRRSAYETRVWDVDRPDPAIFDGVDVVVHLAGEPIMGRFGESHMRKVMDSRVGPTRRLAEAMVASGSSPALVSASAVGLYGTDRGDEVLTEESGRGAAFLADVVVQWEAATRAAAEGGLRVVLVRTAGMVLSGAGGALGMLRPVFGVGAGGRLGDGKQWMSWIALDDIIEVYLRAIMSDDLSGPINAVAPEPVRNEEFTKIFGRVVRRPTLIPTPAFAPKVLLGEKGYEEMLLASHRELPARLTALGHHYRFPKLEACLRHELGR